MIKVGGQSIGKSYIAAAGLFCAAYMKFDAGDISGAVEIGLQALAIIGVRHGISKAASNE